MRTLKAAIFGVVLAVAVAPGVAVAGPFEDGLEAYRSQDYATAFRLLRPLAEQGHAGAQNNRGIMYMEGRGVPQDYAEALWWYQLAAEQDNSRGQLSLGVMYNEGRGGPQDYVGALKWFRLAAEQGHARAQHNLGVMYGKGQGVPQDYVRAHMWFNLAASRMFPGEDHDRAVEGRDWAAKVMTPDQIAETQKLAREWRPVGEQAE